MCESRGVQKVDDLLTRRLALQPAKLLGRQRLHTLAAKSGMYSARLGKAQAGEWAGWVGNGPASWTETEIRRFVYDKVGTGERAS